MRSAAWTRGLFFALLCVLPLACAGNTNKQKEKDSSKKPTEPEPEVKITDISVGTGPAVAKDDFVEINFTGRLADGTQFESTVDRQEPVSFRIGYARNATGIKGLDKGLLNMKEGGERRLAIPPELGYGARGDGGRVPPNSTLIVDVYLIKVRK
jgi:FKBP-type peptidyl-prolyl cis-trans isomerase